MRTPLFQIEKGLKKAKCKSKGREDIWFQDLLESLRKVLMGRGCGNKDCCWHISKIPQKGGAL